MSKIPITIDRSKWRTGMDGPNKTGNGETYLCNYERYMCCLGFVAEQQGVDKKYLICGEPSDCDVEIPHLMTTQINTDEFGDQDYIKKNTALSNYAMSINDDIHTTPQKKEQQLLELFEDSPFELKFVGEFTTS